MVYIRALEKILNEKDIKRSQYAQAKRVCEEALQEIRSAGENQQVLHAEQPGDEESNKEEIEDIHNKGLEQSTLLQSESSLIKIDSEKYFIPFELACQGDSPKVTVAALDGLQKLIAHGLITGNYQNPASPSKLMVDRIVETICNCFVGAETDEGVELQIIKALLTLVTSQHVEIHEGTVLLTLRTCFNIHLATKNTVNQITARAMLTQMLHAIFTRMESALADWKKLETKVPDNIESDSQIEIAEFLERTTSPLEAPLDTPKMNSLDETVANEVVAADEETRHESPVNTEDVQQDVVSIKQQSPADEETETEVSNVPDNLNTMGVDTNVIEANNNSLEPRDVSTPSEDKTTTNFIHVLQKDAFLTFWALCKLAVKQSNIDESVGDVSIMKAVESKAKILSFQLLKSVMENCGICFKNSDIFRTAVKQYLCSAMAHAAVSPVHEIYQLNLDLLSCLIKNFRTSLVPEIEVLCQQILFPVLEPSNSVSNEYKMLSISVINKIFGDIKCLVDIFVHYDCKVAEQNSKICEKMVNYVCKIINEVHGNDNPVPVLGSLKMFAMETLRSLLRQFVIALPKPKSSMTNLNASDTNDSKESQDEMNFVAELISLLLSLSNSSHSVVEIDCMFQKLAQKMFESSYFSDERLDGADSVYALVYSSVVLIGELSTKNQGKGKVSKEQFVQMNRGINNCEPLSDEYIIKTYDEIEAYLQSERRNNRKCQSLAENVVENVANNAKRLIVTMGLQHYSIFSEKQVRSIRRIFKIVGKSVLASLMGVLNECDDTSISDVCLEGIQNGIHVASVLSLKSERDAFVQALSRFSLAAVQQIKSKIIHAKIVTSQTYSTTVTENGVTKTIITTTTETKCRNVDIIQTLLNVAINEGNYLGNSWLDTLKCISQLEAAQLMGDYGSRSSKSTSRSNSPSLTQNNLQVEGSQKSWAAWAGSFVPSFWDSSNKLDMASVKESMGSLVHKIFAESTKLDGAGIVDFLKALCQVSLIEITHPENPRSFVYEKIFEVAHVNMDRPCLQWCSMWQVLADYFSHLACSSDEDVSFFAIDSISKLVVHLLEKEKFENFRFQSHFLQVFDTILKNSQFSSTRGYLLESLTKIVKSYASILRSGWRLIFKILETNVYLGSAIDAEVSFDSIRSIIEMFEIGEVMLANSFEEVIRCLKDFAFKAPSEEMRNESVNLLMKIAKIVHNKPELLVDPSESKKDKIWMRGWSPLFNQLSFVVLYSEADEYDESMQASSLSLFFELVKTYGESFQKTWWKSLFDILFRVFDKLKFHEENIVPDASIASSGDKGNYSQYYCYYYAQFAITDTFIKHFNTVGDIILNELLEQLNWCISQDHEQIALSGVQCFNNVIRMLEDKFSPEEWTLISTLVQTMIQTNYTGSPAIENSEEPYLSSLPTGNTIVKLELLKLTKNVMFKETKVQDSTSESTEAQATEDSLEGRPTTEWNIRNAYSGEQLFSFLSTLEVIQRTLKSLNAPAETEGRNDPSLLPHETMCLDMLTKLIFNMYEHRKWFKNDYDLLETRLLQLMTSFTERFASMADKNYRDSIADSMNFCLERIVNFPSNKFKMFSCSLYSNLCDMLEMDLKPSLSHTLSAYFLTIGKSIDVFHMESYKSGATLRKITNNFQITFHSPESLTSSG